MERKVLSEKLLAQAVRWQKEEITGYFTYNRLAHVIKDDHNREVVARIAGEEMSHYNTLKQYSGRDVRPDRGKVFLFSWLSRLFGLTFGLKLMERSEEKAQASYTEFLEEIPELEPILREEEEHETQLLDMLDEEVLKYTGSVVLGLNDALVELTGTLAGLTFAFQNTNLIALSGLITGFSASLSMAASEYLSARAGEGETHAGRSALYTGMAYVFTVTVLVFPYLLLDNYMLCLAWTLLNAVLVIAVFNAYLAVARDLNFIKRFGEMALISIGVAVFSFGVGLLIRSVFGIDV
ncbi:MAG: VIT1/CCC1 transporter family protein [Anaerolineales bacterium]|nr:VIT1/CCC1 transporter family protein [Anaerolineales bacterium]